MSKSIAVFYSDRSELGLLQPVIRELKRVSEFEIKKVDMSTIFKNIDRDDLLGHLYKLIFSFLDINKVDFAVCPFDRREVMIAALACFIHGTPFATMHSGSVGSFKGSHDHIFRHQIMMMSEIQFCNGEVAHANACRILEGVGRKTDKCFDVGSTAFDEEDMREMNMVKIPWKNFNMIVLHPNTHSQKATENDIREIKKFISNNTIKTIIIGPNRDKHGKIIHEEWKWAANLENVEYHPNGFERPIFMAYMKSCNKLVGNSSSLLYEAPFLKEREDIILIGKRNKDRDLVKSPLLGGAKRVVEVLEEYL